MTTENQTPLTAAELIENEHGRFHPSLPIENNMQPIKWIKEHGMKAQIVEIEDAEHSLSEWHPESDYEGAFPVAIFQPNEWDDESFTAIFAYEDSHANREIKLKRLAEQLHESDDGAAAYIKLWFDHYMAQIEKAANTDAQKIDIGGTVITDPQQIKFFNFGMIVAISQLNDCPVDVDWNR